MCGASSVLFGVSAARAPPWKKKILSVSRNYCIVLNHQPHIRVALNKRNSACRPNCDNSNYKVGFILKLGEHWAFSRVCPSPFDLVLGFFRDSMRQNQ